MLYTTSILDTTLIYLFNIQKKDGEETPENNDGDASQTETEEISDEEEKS